MKTYQGEGGVFYNYATDELFTLKRLGPAEGLKKLGQHVYIFEDEQGELIGGFLELPTIVQLDGPEAVHVHPVWIGK